ncbi:host specificity J domain protein [Escherichia coli DEC11A]|nr:host specificity J domain protein [Escherichia coli DEC11A]
MAGIGAGIEDTDGQPLSNILLLADRIAMINPESGNRPLRYLWRRGISCS